MGEDGHSDVARRRQAVLVARECLTIWALGLPVAVLYDLRDDGSNPSEKEDNFGLLDQNNDDKPAMKAVRVLTSVATGHTYPGPIQDVPHGVSAMRLDGVDDIVFVVWTDDPEIRPHIRCSSDELLSVSKMFGEPIITARDELVLDEAMGPVYVRLKSATRKEWSPTRSNLRDSASPEF